MADFCIIFFISECEVRYFDCSTSEDDDILNRVVAVEKCDGETLNENTAGNNFDIDALLALNNLLKVINTTSFYYIVPQYYHVMLKMNYSRQPDSMA